MADYYDYNETSGSRNATMLEGVYKGLMSKIEELKKELQYANSQQSSSYETLTDSLEENVEALLAEMRYIAQQNSAIHDYNESSHAGLQETLVEAMRISSEEIQKRCAEQIEQAMEIMLDKIDALREEMLANGKVRYAEPVVHEEEPVKAESVKAQAPVEPITEETFDYDLLAEKISTILPENDYDTAVERVLTAVPTVDAITDAVVAAVPPVDETAIADKVAETILPVDYDLIAERVAGALEHEFDVTIDEEGIEKLAQRVVELLEEKGLAVVADAEPEPAPAPAPAPVAVVEPEPEPEPEPAPAPAPVAKAPVAAAVPAPAPVEEEPETLTRLKRSFEAKIVESDEEIKGYYGDIKNALLSYGNVHSQISWSNDRFTYNRDTLAKISIRGKTLCLYLALNPDEFPESVYHQRYAGDTKMYEKTPLMMRIKSKVSVKRSIRLIELLMEKAGTVKLENPTVVDYVHRYKWRSEQELLDEGLIKTAVVDKTDLDF